ncbi:peptidoglycan D,D-transpeptidase FtsI family protein [Saccharomonospora xinjiangensis]|uniref:peptidoglycan D,D-transpeptidase FtsI family protein n=1 Tax=Saccharomonospora xinjiangensis TaxID=75294 RepID=UPI00350FA987
MQGQRGTRGTGSGGGPHRTYSVRARRSRSATTVRDNRNRFVAGRIVLTLVLVAAGLKLVHIQAFEASALSERAERQRTTIIDIPAERGSIVDRNGAELAFSVETRKLWVNLRQMRKDWAEYAQEHPGSGKNFETRAAEIADHIARQVPHLVTEQELLDDFHKDGSFTYLVDDVEPSVAEKISKRFPEIGYEKRAKRVYPGEEVAANIVGYANWRTDSPEVSEHNLHGLSGLESYRDADLVGTPGRQIVDTAQGADVVIPGTERDMQAATPGSDLELTIDSDVQYELQRSLAAYVDKVKAKGGSAVILDARTAEVYALANHKTFDPNEPPSSPDAMGNPAVSTPFEPGSVAKIITAVAAIESGTATPERELSVPGSMRVADHTVHDAWSHGTQNFTVTGIFGKSSNVGTLLLADEIGPDRFLATLTKFGAGQRTGIGLPGESPGYVPPREKWSGTTYGNLPIGQGLSMTVVQMTSMYQAIANGGVRVEPRVVKAKVTPDGRRIPEPAPDSVRVTDPKTADTVKNMLRSTMQGGEYAYSGTAPEAALEGYQISGKTGTGQQIDPRTGGYSDRLHNITFAGILPAEEPRFVVGIWLDAPDTTIPGGSSAGALFSEIASYLAQRYNIPVSGDPGQRVRLVR